MLTDTRMRPDSDWELEICGVARRQGIYRILNQRDGKCYVGSAKNMRGRWFKHMRQLLSGSSAHIRLGRAWDKHGSAAFVFEVLEWVSDVSLLLEREQFWMDRLNASVTGYNVRKRAESNLGIQFGPPSELTRQRISAGLVGKTAGRPSCRLGKTQTNRSRAQMRATKRAREHMQIKHGGLSLCLSDWADKIGITTRALGNRLRRGWSLERAFSEPSRGY